MAFTPCTKSVTKNIVPDCSNPRIKGWERTGVGMKRSDIDFATSTSTDFGIEFPLLAAKKPFAIFNKKQNPLPFNGTQVAANIDAEGWDKKIQFYYEGVGADANAVMAALMAEEYVIILERKYKVAGNYVMFGYEVGLTLESAACDEETGYWLVTMKTTEHDAELNFGVSDDVDLNKAAFDALLALAV